jgi:hypothetical protein
MALLSTVKKVLKKSAAAARKESGEAGKKRRAAKRKAEEAKKKASKKAAKSPKATQKDVRFKKKAELQEGAALDPETGRSVSAARDVESGRAGKVTRGKFSVTNFIKDQMAMSPGMQSRRETNNAFQRAINKAETQAEKDKLRAALEKIRKRREKVDVAAEGRRRSNISKGVREAARKPKEVDNYDVANKALIGEPGKPQTGGELVPEFFKLTENQQVSLLRGAEARLTPAKYRQLLAKAEEKRLRDRGGNIGTGETALGARKGTRLGRVRGEEEQVKGMISGTRRDGVTKLRPENEDTLRRRTRRNKGGMVKKKAIGATDYRMNKGGLLLSSVDNRKKK